MTNTSAHSAAIATAFEPPQDDADMQEDATEQDRLVTQDPDPARFGIHVQPTTNVRRLLMPHGTDGVFANMSAKPEVGEIKDEHPPVSYMIVHLRVKGTKQFRLTMRQQRTMLHLIGTKLCIYLEARMRSTSMVSPSDMCSDFFGT